MNPNQPTGTSGVPLSGPAALHQQKAAGYAAQGQAARAQGDYGGFISAEVKSAGHKIAQFMSRNPRPATGTGATGAGMAGTSGTTGAPTGATQHYEQSTTTTTTTRP
jgi:hypothetical protein